MIDDFYEELCVIVPVSVSDGLGNRTTTYQTGERFKGGLYVAQQNEVNVGEKMDVKSVYKLMTSKALKHGDMFKRVLTGDMFTIIDCGELPPTMSTAVVPVYTAEVFRD